MYLHNLSFFFFAFVCSVKNNQRSNFLHIFSKDCSCYAHHRQHFMILQVVKSSAKFQGEALYIRNIQAIFNYYKFGNKRRYSFPYIVSNCFLQTLLTCQDPCYVILYHRADSEHVQNSYKYIRR